MRWTNYAIRKKGLDGKIIAMWQSHGFYFEPKEDRWEWQRARDFKPWKTSTRRVS